MPTNKGVLWILRQANKALQLEIRHNLSASGYELVITYPDGRTVSEDVEESSELLLRAVEVLKTLREQGWLPDSVPSARTAPVGSKP